MKKSDQMKQKSKQMSNLELAISNYDALEDFK